ncbi:MAG: hypothetical protein K2J41_01650, partial [Eubacterium sp.]|nr:hypothetical protein [Eubacterium sp.]
DMFEIYDKSNIEKSDIDFSKMIREFVGLDVFQDDELTDSKMQEYTANQKIYYQLPVQHEGATVLSVLQIGEALDDEAKKDLSAEDIEFYENETGKWIISFSDARLRIVDNYKDIVERALEKNNIQNSKVYFVGAPCSHIDLAAVICNDNPEDTRVMVLEQYHSECGFIDESKALDGQILFEKDALYTYDEIKAIVDADKEASANLPEGSVGYMGVPLQTSVTTPTTDNSKIIIISAVSGAAVLAAAIAAVCIVKKKKAVKVLDENDIKGC